MTSAELTGWLAYLSVDDEVQAQRIAYAIVKAFGGGKAQKHAVDEDEEVIDTTSPDFAKNFKGFTGTPAPPQRGIPQRQMMSTEILLG